MKKGLIIALVAVILAGGITTAIVVNSKKNVEEAKTTIIDTTSEITTSTSFDDDNDKVSDVDDVIEIDDITNISISELQSLAKSMGYSESYSEAMHVYTFEKAINDNVALVEAQINDNTIVSLRIIVPTDVKSNEYFSKFDLLSNEYDCEYLGHSNTVAYFNFNNEKALLSASTSDDLGKYGKNVIEIIITTNKYYSLINNSDIETMYKNSVDAHEQSKDLG